MRRPRVSIRAHHAKIRAKPAQVALAPGEGENDTHGHGTTAGFGLCSRGAQLWSCRGGIGSAVPVNPADGAIEHGDVANRVLRHAVEQHEPHLNSDRKSVV